MRVRDINKEQAIKQQAMEMIVNEGLDGFSMQKLAKAANVSPATLYIYYEDKDDLIFKIAEEWTIKSMASSLEGLHPKMSFAQGMEIQWKNRLAFYLSHQTEIDFLEVIRYSNFYDRLRIVVKSKFSDQLGAFVHNAINRGELQPLPFEVYWCIAFGPLYQLLKFHSQGKSHGNDQFSLSTEMVDLTLQLVLKALKP